MIKPILTLIPKFPTIFYFIGLEMSKDQRVIDFLGQLLWLDKKRGRPNPKKSEKENIFYWCLSFVYLLILQYGDFFLMNEETNSRLLGALKSLIFDGVRKFHISCEMV
jgi:hypothetical protein